MIIYATPLYCGNSSSQMKALIDRHFCLLKGLGPIEGNADLMPELFGRMAETLQCRVMGTHILPFCTTPEKLGPEAAALAARMANEVLVAAGEQGEASPVFP